MLISYDRFLRRNSWPPWAFSFLAFLLALLLKESAAIYPLVLLCYGPAVRARSFRSQLRPLLPFFVFLAIFLAVRFYVVSSLPASETPPKISLRPLDLAYAYSRSLFSTIIQSQGIRDPRNDFPIYFSDIISPRDYLGLLATAGFFAAGGFLLVKRGAETARRGFLFGLIVLLIATAMVAAWFRTNLLFIGSLGVSVMAGILLSAVFQPAAQPRPAGDRAARILTVLFFCALLGVNLSSFFEIQEALRPDGFLACTWDRWVCDDYLPWVGREQLFLLEGKLRGGGRNELADLVAARIISPAKP